MLLCAFCFLLVLDAIPLLSPACLPFKFLFVRTLLGGKVFSLLMAMDLDRWVVEDVVVREVRCSFFSRVLLCCVEFSLCLDSCALAYGLLALEHLYRLSWAAGKLPSLSWLWA